MDRKNKIKRMTKNRLLRMKNGMGTKLSATYRINVAIPIMSQSLPK